MRSEKMNLILSWACSPSVWFVYLVFVLLCWALICSTLMADGTLGFVIFFYVEGSSRGVEPSLGNTTGISNIKQMGNN